VIVLRDFEELRRWKRRRAECQRERRKVRLHRARQALRTLLVRRLGEGR